MKFEKFSSFMLFLLCCAFINIRPTLIFSFSTEFLLLLLWFDANKGNILFEVENANGKSLKQTLSFIQITQHKFPEILKIMFIHFFCVAEEISCFRILKFIFPIWLWMWNWEWNRWDEKDGKFFILINPHIVCELFTKFSQHRKIWLIFNRVSYFSKKSVSFSGKSEEWSLKMQT